MDRLRQVLNSPLGRRKNGITTPKVFGVGLDDLVKLRPNSANVTLDNGINSDKSTHVPFIVDRICRHIFANGIEEEGIFRVNGNARVIEKLRECFEKHGDADLESAEDIFAVAGLLKLFLRELPESVIPESMTSKFVHCQEVSKHDKAECVRKLKVLVNDLPKAHYDTLKYIIRFLVDVAAKDSNKMSPMGLAIVFGPNLFRCSSGIEGLKDQGVTNEIVCKFLNEYTTLFGEITEPGPFTVPHIHQNREKRKQAPARPPPPKIADNNPTLAVTMDFNEDIRPTTSFSQEFMERASPFTIADGDGHSSIASPVLSAVASELVTKTISEAVLEHIFSEVDVRSIFDNWGETDDASSRGSTPHSSLYHHHSRRTPSNLSSLSNHRHDESRPDTVYSGKDVAPQPRPRPTTTEETPQPKPRLHRQSSKTSELMEDLQPAQLEPPKPKPRTKSAPPRHGSLGEVLHHSIDMPVVNTQHNHTNHQTIYPSTPDSMHQSNLYQTEHSKHDTTNSVTSSTHNHHSLESGAADDFDSIKSSTSVLQHFQKPKGPTKKVPRKQKSLTMSDKELSQQTTPVDVHTPIDVHTDFEAALNAVEMHNDVNNNASKDNVSNGSDKENQLQVIPQADIKSPVPKLDLDNRNHSSKKRAEIHEDVIQPSTVIVVHTPAEEVASPQPMEATSARSSAKTKSTQGDHLEVNGGEALLATTPAGDKQMEGLTPEPKPQRNEAEEEKRQADIKALNKKINALKKKVRVFEESFEAENGHKPSTQEKNSKLDIKKALVELAKCRKELKSLGGTEIVDTDLKEAVDTSRVDSIEPPAASTENAGSRSESVVPGGGTSSEPPTMADTLELLLKRLKDKRMEANRADEISTLTRDQVQEEKLAVQKALLHFESIHGRPQTKSEKELMRPLYDRYRQIKKALATAPISKPEAKADEGDPTDMLVTQHPAGDGASAHGGSGADNHLHNGEEEERGDSPTDKNSRETNLQELPVHELKSELDKANNTKKKLRKLLRDFEDEFQKGNNRKVQKEDRGPMESKYQEYKQIKAKIKLLEVLISKHEGV